MMLLKIGTRFVPGDSVQLRVVDNRITGYFIGAPAAADPTWVDVAAGSDVSYGKFGTGGYFQKTVEA